MAPSVSIVLPTYQGEAYLKETLPAICSQQYEGKVEIVGIDSTSSDASVALLGQYGARVQIIPQSEFGHGTTRNLGVALSRHEIIVFLSQDAVPVGPFWLRDLVSILDDRKIGAVFARQLPRENATPFERHLHRRIYPARSRVYHHRPKSELSLQNLFFSNVCSAARREVCQRFPFDETVIMSEDQFFARDILQGGLAIAYNAKACVVHSHHYGLVALFRRNFDSGYSLRNLTNEKGHRKLAMALRFLSSEAWFVARERKLAWLLYLPFYEGTRIAALLLGSRADKLPPRLRRAMSLHRSFWDKAT